MRVVGIQMIIAASTVDEIVWDLQRGKEKGLTFTCWPEKELARDRAFQISAPSESR